MPSPIVFLSCLHLAISCVLTCQLFLSFPSCHLLCRLFLFCPHLSSFYLVSILSSPVSSPIVFLSCLHLVFSCALTYRLSILTPSCHLLCPHLSALSLVSILSSPLSSISLLSSPIIFLSCLHLVFSCVLTCHLFLSSFFLLYAVSVLSAHIIIKL